MRNLKKVLTLVLTVAMLLSIMVVGTGAAFSDQDQIKNKEAVDVAVALNIIDGMEDGSYRPANNVTRAQMCKMICVALNGGKEPTLGTSSTPTFTDVRTDATSSWAESFIESCYTQGIVSGVGGNRFNPSGSVTGTQAARMLLVALGFNAEHEKFTGESWDINVNVRATQKGLYEGLESIDPNAALNRDNAAQMIKNALDATIVSYNNEFTTVNGQIVATPVLADKTSQNGEPVTLLEDKYDGKTEEGTLTSFNYDANKAEWTYTVGEENAGTYTTIAQVKSSNDYTSLLGQNVEAIYDNSNENAAVKPAYGIYASDSSVLVSGTVGNIGTLENDATSIKVDGATYRFESGVEANAVPVKEFSPNWDPYTADDLAALAGGGSASPIKTYDAQRFSAIDEDGNGRIDSIMIYPITVAKVTSLTSSAVGLTDVNSSSVSGIPEREDMNVYDGIARNDWVIYTAEDNTSNSTAVISKADLISGKITRVSGSDLTVDGTVYTKDVSFATVTGVGSTLTDAVVLNGYIFNATVDAASANATDYIVAVSDAEESFGTVRARVMFSDGSKNTIDLEQVATYSGSTLGAPADASDGMSLAGKIFTYTTNSSNEYTLTEVKTDTTTGIQKASNSSTKVGFINGNAISDDAVIFVQYGSGKYDVISGATMKTMNVTHKDGSGNDVPSWGLKYLQRTDNESTGVGTLNIAFVTYTQSSLSVSDTHYGYITAVASIQNADNKDIKEVTLWTKDKETVLNTTNGIQASITSADEGKVISYTLDSNGNMDSVNKTAASVGELTAKTSAIVTIGGSRYDLTDDTIILGVDVDGPSGSVNDGSYNDLSVNENVYYITNDDGDEIVLIVYATNGTIPSP